MVWVVHSLKHEDAGAGGEDGVPFILEGGGCGGCGGCVPGVEVGGVVDGDVVLDG